MPIYLCIVGIWKNFTYFDEFMPIGVYLKIMQLFYSVSVNLTGIMNIAK